MHFPAFSIVSTKSVRGGGLLVSSLLLCHASVFRTFLSHALPHFKESLHVLALDQYPAEASNRLIWCLDNF